MARGDGKETKDGDEIMAKGNLLRVIEPITTQRVKEAKEMANRRSPPMPVMGAAIV